MSTLEIGRGQGIWGASLALWALYFVFAPVRLAFRVERALREAAGRVEKDKRLFVFVLRDVVTGREIARAREE